MRKIGQKALGDIFSLLKRGRLGGHSLRRAGGAGEHTEDTKRYEYGDPFLVDVERTLMNAVQREGEGRPVNVEAEDFEVYRNEYLTQASTVLMIDLSWSMALRGHFVAAKKVALALETLIRTQFPRDSILVLGFALYAREMKRDALLRLSIDERTYGTNMHHALTMAREFLEKHRSPNRQIIMITDGEPTAHLENGVAYFQYPPAPATVRATLGEVRRCTREGIVINTFMLDRSHYLKEFISHVSKMNKGRAFFTTSDKLGEYILVDYLSSKRKRVV